MAADPTTTALAAVAYLAGHHLGDYWAQTDHQAAHKPSPGWAGRRACAAHVATLTAAHAVALALVLAATATSVHPVSAALGLVVTAASHYWADRRWTLTALADRITHTSAFRGCGGGMAHLDQSWHVGWIVPAALTTAAPPAGAALVATTAALVLAVCHATAVRASPPPRH